MDLPQLIKSWAAELGLQDLKFTAPSVGEDASHLKDWLLQGRHQPLTWMTDHGNMRYTPSALQPSVQTVISARMHYLPEEVALVEPLKAPNKAYISRYALGRDYHKVFRKRLAKLASKINEQFPDSINRALVDSAPVMEKPLGRNAGHGWMGKHTLILNEKDGSYFFLGEIFSSLNIPFDNEVAEDLCGTCSACLKVCPTDAFHGPYDLELKRCISYLTIENDGPIPIEFREPMGNRVFGCDDCQIICPYNKVPRTTSEEAFSPRHGLDDIELVELFEWTESDFNEYTQGSPIRRAGYLNFMRNVAVGLGNAPKSERIIEALTQKRAQNLSDLLNEHIDWALEQQHSGKKRRRKIRRQV